MDQLSGPMRWGERTKNQQNVSQPLIQHSMIQNSKQTTIPDANQIDMVDLDSEQISVELQNLVDAVPQYKAPKQQVNMRDLRLDLMGHRKQELKIDQQYEKQFELIDVEPRNNPSPGNKQNKDKKAKMVFKAASKKIDAKNQKAPQRNQPSLKGIKSLDSSPVARVLPKS